ncbi:MAG: DUF86 domain-containing protein [Phycisphaerae bacterium]|nr:DUF86 domain-containing protein [Saprospiraceae bacterium]
MKREIGDFLNDILVSAERAERFLGDKNSEELKEDSAEGIAIVRCLEIIGEAVKKIPDEVRENYPELPWKRWAGMRDKLIHDYWSIDMEIVYESVKLRLPLLKKVVQKMLEDLNNKP